MATYICEITELRVREGEVVDLARWNKAQMDEWVVKNVIKPPRQHGIPDDTKWIDYRERPNAFGRVAPRVNWVKNGEFKSPLKFLACKRDRRLKGWRDWED